MRTKLGAIACLLGVGFSGKAFAGAFEVKTSQGTLPKQESARPLSIPKSLLHIDVSFEYTSGLSGFNNNGQNECDPVLAQGDGCDLTKGDTSSYLLTLADGEATQPTLAYNQVDKMVTRLNVRYGLTNNWTFGLDMPVVSAGESYVVADEANVNSQNLLNLLLTNGTLPQRSTLALGDMSFLLQYQFLRDFEGPMRALVGRVLAKMPTGNESPGSANKQVRDPVTGEITFTDVRALVTGTGTNDLEFGVAYKQQLGSALAISLDGAYNLRLPGFVEYMFDDTGIQFADGLIPSAKLNLGDQISLKGRLTVSPSESWFATLDLRFLTWGATGVARARLEAAQEILVDENTTEERGVFLGGRYLDIPESAGFLTTVTPRFVYQPNDWLEVGANLDLHVMGKNTNYVRSNNITKQGDEATTFGFVGAEENQFFALEALGVPVGSMILGTTRLGATIKW